MLGLPAHPRLLRRRVECEVERQHVDARLAEDAPLPAFGMLLDELPELFRRNISGFCNSLDLELGRGRRDVRVEAGARSGREVGRDALRRPFAIIIEDPSATSSGFAANA